MSGRRSRQPADDVTGLDLDAILVDPDIEAPSSTHPTRPTLIHASAVFAGGCLGTLARYAVTFNVHLAPRAFPWVIMTINVVGALLLGVLGGSLFTSRPQAVTLRLFLGAGVLGGWTTYSSVIVGLVTLAHLGSWVLCGLNFIVAVVLPLAAAAIGLVIGDLLIRSGRT